MSINIKNMTPQDREAAYREISRQSGDDRYFTRKELNELPRMLGDQEVLIAFSSGLHDGATWLIALTNQQVLFLDKGMFFGLKQINIPLDKINSISSKVGLFFGQIMIEDGASTYGIENITKASATYFAAKVREAIAVRRLPYAGAAPVATTVTQNPAEDRLQKLERLATLMDKGILSKAEFDTEKAKILNS